MSAERAAEERLVEAMEFNVLWEHRYDINSRGVKPDDPGWHPCACGDWQGYWCDWHNHVARALLAGPVGAALAEARREAVEDAADRLATSGNWLRPAGAAEWLRDRAAGVDS